MLCGACNTHLGRKESGDGETVSCSKCPKKFHSLCLKLTREDNKALRLNNNKLVCPSCKLKNKPIRNDDTPIRSCSQNKDSAQELQRDPPESVDSSFLSTAQGLADMPVPKEVLSAFTAALQQLQQVFMSMKQEMKDFTASLNYTSEDITQFRCEMSEIKTQLKELDTYKAEVKLLQAEVADLRLELAAKEQQKFRKDIEITGIPENRSENLQQAVNVVCTTLGVQLDPRDVDDVRRVGKKGENATASAERPRPVVLTLTRRAPRDQILRAARVRRELTTASLGIAGNSRQVYINEHLTKANRVLFSKTRAVKKQLKFKFAWTSNGSIFLRRSETSSVIHVYNETVLDKLITNPHSSQSLTRTAGAAGDNRDGFPPSSQSTGTRSDDITRAATIQQNSQGQSFLSGPIQ